MPPQDQSATPASTEPKFLVKVVNEAHYLFGEIGTVLSKTEHEVVVLFESAGEKIKETFEPKHVAPIKASVPTPPASSLTDKIKQAELDRAAKLAKIEADKEADIKAQAELDAEEAASKKAAPALANDQTPAAAPDPTADKPSAATSTPASTGTQGGNA